MKRLLFFCGSLFLLGSCVNTATQKPLAEGNPGEVTIYIPEEFRNQGIEEVVDSALDKTVNSGLTPEPMFDVKFETEKELKNIRSLNLIEINIDDSNNPQVYSKIEGLNARNQYHLIVYGKSVENVKSILKDHAANIRSGLNNNEYDRAYKRMIYGQKRHISNKIFEKQNIDILIPSFMDDFLYNSPEFSMVAGYQTRYADVGKLIIQEYLFVMNFPDNGDSLNFTPEGLLWQINRYLKTWALVDNSRGGNAYMQINNDSSTIPFKTMLSEFRNLPSMELAGNMSSFDPDGSTPTYGGYFTGIAVRDTKQNRIVVAIGMANVPKDFLYRDYLREMKVIVHTLQF